MYINQLYYDDWIMNNIPIIPNNWMKNRIHTCDVGYSSWYKLNFVMFIIIIMK